MPGGLRHLSCARGSLIRRSLTAKRTLARKGSCRGTRKGQEAPRSNRIARLIRSCRTDSKQNSTIFALNCWYLAKQRDSTARLLEDLPRRFAPRDVEQGGPNQRAWELVAFLHSSWGRPYEALQIFWLLFQHMLAAQQQGRRVHKGMPLIWMSDCFRDLRCPLHEKTLSHAHTVRRRNSKQR